VESLKASCQATMAADCVRQNHMRRSSDFRDSAASPPGEILTNWLCSNLVRGVSTSRLCRFRVASQHVTHTSGLAVQKSQANRNVPEGTHFAVCGLAVQKSQANRNRLERMSHSWRGLAVQKSQANRNSVGSLHWTLHGLAVQKSQANRNCLT